MKITASGPMTSNRKRCQGSSWTVVPAEEEERKKERKKEDIMWTFVLLRVTTS
jgi:hypothetical protein